MLKFLMERRDSLINASKDILSKAENEKRILTEEEKKTVEANAKELKEISSQIEVAKGVAEEEETSSKLSPTTAAQKVRPVVTPGGPSAKKEFENIAEFMHAALFNQDDARLASLYQDFKPRAEQSMGTGAKGGFAIPTQFISTIRSVEPDAAFMRSGATVIPAGDPPDAAITMPALDQEPNAAGTQQVYAGVSVNWTAEGGTMTETDANLRDITLEPKEITGYITLTNKLLRNWGAASSVITELLKKAVNGAEDYAFITGDGVGKPYGFKNHASAYVQSRAGGGAIAFADIKNMWARFMGNPENAVWGCSRSAFAALLSLVGDGGGATNIIGFDKATNMNTIYGAPIMRVGRGFSALGTKGDLCLIDRSNYLIKDGSGPFIEASPHVKWTQNKTVVKVVWNVDGSSWMSKTMKDEAGYEGSPIVVLNT